MKWTKRLLSVVLSLLMIVGLLPLSALPVFAGSGGNWDDAVELSLDTIAYSSYEGEQAWFVYTPVETGIYTFKSLDETELDPKVYVYETPDIPDEYIATNDDGGDDYNFYCEVDLNAGVTYYFLVEEVGGENVRTVPVILTYGTELSSATEMTLDEDYVVEIEESYGCQWFSFTSETGGYYSFYSFGYEGSIDPKATLYKKMMQELETNDDSDGKNFRIDHFVAAGETVYLKAYGWNDSTGVYMLKVGQLQPPAAMSIKQGDTYTAYVDEVVYFDAVFTPENAYSEDVMWRSSNTDVLMFDPDSPGRGVCVADGTVTVTATSDSGLSDTCIVTVKTAPVLELGTPYSATIPFVIDRHCFDFTPATTGNYCLAVTPQNGKMRGMNWNLYSDDDNTFEGGENSSDDSNEWIIQAKLSAGCTYRLCLMRTEDFDVDSSATAFTIEVQNIPAATGIAISYDGETTDTISGYPNDVLWLGHKMVPSNAMWESVSYTSSDEDIVEVDGNELHLVATGTATITATSENGLTATIEVTVQDYPTLVLGEPYHAEVSPEETCWFKFVPTASGYYNFISSNNSGDVYGKLYDADMDLIIENDDGAGNYNFKLQSYLDAGEIYYLRVRSYTDNSTTFDVTVSKPPKATKIAFAQGTSVSAYQGGVQYFDLVYTPADAVREKITWKSSNTNVVKIVSQDNESVQVWYKGAGKATLTATTATTKLKATITITVTGAVATSLNTVKTGTINKTRRNYSFKYTPSTSGDYILYVGGTHNYVGLCESTSDGPQEGGELYGHTTTRLTAKKTYYFSVTFYEDKTGEFTFLIYKQKTATAISLNETSINLAPGEERSLPSVSVVPALSTIGDISWTVDDEDVAYIEDDCLWGANEGVTTLTATTAEGLKATATITVGAVNYKTYCVGEEITETAEGGKRRWYTFSPSVSGYYTASSRSEDHVDPRITLYDSEMNKIVEADDEVGMHFNVGLNLQADQTYYAEIYIYQYSEDVDPFTWSIKVAAPPTGIEIVQGDTYTGYVNGGVNLDVAFLPTGAATEKYTFTVVGDAVSVDNWGSVEFLELGTATVIVTSASGLTDSIEITVVGIPTMAEGMSYPLGFSGNKMLMKFVPTETAVYSFYTDVSEKLVSPSVLNEDGNYLDVQEFYNANSSLMQIKLTAGETYYLRLYCYEDVPLGATTRVVKTTKKGAPTLDVKSTTKIQGRTEFLYLSATDPTVDYGQVMGWATSDAKLATIHSEGYIRYIRAGKVTITAQCTYGDAKVTLTIKAATAMTLGKVYTVKGSSGIHKFAPTKDGYYAFYSYDGNGTHTPMGDVMDPQGIWLEGDYQNGGYVVYLVKGQTYYWVTIPRDGGGDTKPTTSYKVKVGSGKAPAASKGVFEMESDGEDAFVPTGEMAVVRIKARGEGLTYKWYYANKGKYTYAASSITKDTYSVKMDSTRNGRKLFCVVTDKYGNKMTSDIVTIGIKKPLKITTQLTNAVAKNGATIKASFAASGDGLSYTWYYKDAGAKEFTITNSFKSTSYTTTMNSARASRQIFCVVTDKYGNALKTATVTLYMGNPIKITAQPKSVKVKNGATAKATVKASGDGLTYQWYVKNKGAKSYSKSSNKTKTYSVKMTTKVNGRQIYCVVKDKYGKTVKSSTVTLKKK